MDEDKTTVSNQGTSSLYFKLSLLVSSFLLILMVVTMAVSMNHSLNALHSQIEELLVSTSTSLAESSAVKDALRNGECPPQLVEYLDSFVEHTDDIDLITIADRDSIRVYHIVHVRIGQPFVGDDQGPALQGESYFSDAVGTMGPQHRYLTPVRDGDEVIGFVMASTTLHKLDELHNNSLLLYMRLSFLLFPVLIVLILVLSMLIRRALHGFEPETLVRDYLRQNEILENLNEGLISVDDKGRVQMISRPAEEMLNRPADSLMNQPLDSLITEKMGGSLLAGPRSEVPTSLPDVLASSIPIEKNGRRNGTTLILTDRSEAMRTAEQLNGTRHLISTLRASTHEFMNKIQVISGLLMMDRKDDALEYIGSIADTHARAAAPILRHIQNPGVAALLLGKSANMRELDIDFSLLANSNLPKHSNYLSTDNLVTIIGNLLENAMEALRTNTGDDASIALELTEDDNGLLIMVSDNGCGIAPEDLEHIYDPGFSTKAQEGRGMGMFLIKDLADRLGGSIEVDSEPGVGTTFTLIFSQPRTRRTTA